MGVMDLAGFPDRVKALHADDPSSIATATPPAVVLRPKRLRWWGAFAFFTLAAGIGVAYAEMRPRSRAALDDPAQHVTAQGSPPLPPSSPTPQPSASPSASAELVPIASAPPLVASAGTLPRHGSTIPAVTARPKVSDVASPPTAPTRCDPPYWVDEHGVKHWVVACLAQP